MTFNEFRHEIDKLPENFENRDLETYLLAIYENLEDNKHIYEKEQATFDLILCILKESFTSKSATFNMDWLNITEAPDPNQSNRKFTASEVKDKFDKTNLDKSSGLEFTMSVLRFQISELYKMRDKQLKVEDRYFGIDSETGNCWYNFDPFTNLECGIRCMDDNNDTCGNLDWSFIGHLLEDGRIYE